MTNPLENALQRGTFNVLDAVRGRGYPTDTVTIYTAYDANYEARQIKAKLASETDEDKVKGLESRLGTLLAEVKASALTFHMRGVTPAVIDSINAEAEARFRPEPIEGVEESESADEEATWIAYKIACAHIFKVENAQGEVDESEWTVEKFTELADIIGPSETAAIIEEANLLTFTAAAFDEVVGPDFS